MKGYYFITDSRLSRAGNISDVMEAAACKVEAVQYRNKNAETRVMYEEALHLREICRDLTFLINDRIDIALAVGADGVHLGQTDMPCKTAREMLGEEKIIGVTVHNLFEALVAKRDGADYLGVSPIFQTATKSDAGKPAGIALIEEIRRKVDIPLIAIGGINLSNAPEVIGAGADGLCAISCVVESDDVSAQINRFQDLF
ncbi:MULTISPECIES: thiamine phosphate synthase [unclassified Methanothrix]|uniref:thiamine phosphate synthase n=3 Tax=Methanotrichaceae TaxID=143067 RepID=UPI001B4ACEDE|nr:MULTISPECIES: thiamine phosphate synthase [unclassified Methanothrix]MBP7069070.1 thiamine phosphate synthase [Methanothrix sp.]